MDEKDTIYRVALAGLLHDIGKFAQRAGGPSERRNHAEIGAGWIEEMTDLFPRPVWEDLADAVAEHHASHPSKRIARIVKLADWMASSERQKAVVPRQEPATTPLIPVLARVELTLEPPREPWGFIPHLLKPDHLFPQKGWEIVTPEHYQRLWEQFKGEVDHLKQAGLIPTSSQLALWLSLLRKYLTFVPSATPWEVGLEESERTLPDVSLYDHVKVTAAIAVCLERALTDDELERLLRRDEVAWNEPIALMVRGDLSGIQNFIYRVTRPAGDVTFRGVARRLRGRSFYLALLGDVVADWLLRELNLPPTNLLFCGGGRFDLLIPRTRVAEEKVTHCLEKLEDWLLGTFYGELGIQFAIQEVKPVDFADMRGVYNALEEKLNQRKTRKWIRYALRDDFHAPEQETFHACPVCRITPVGETDQICDLCDLHHRLGGALPRAQWMTFVVGAEGDGLDGTSVRFPFADTTVWLMDDAQVQTFLGSSLYQPGTATLYRLNDTRFIPNVVPRSLGLGFRFLANTAPVARAEIRLPGREEPTRPGDVLDFEEIAEFSQGAKRLGVLKADIDRLGFIFSMGLEPLTISRQAALSDAVDRFFCGWVNRMCEAVFQGWREGAGSDHPWKDAITNFFYTMYAGGDDLFIVGPWDQILELAHQLEADFARYACENPNVTLSAGVLQVKPHHPVQQFAQMVSERLGRAKSAGRARIDVFNHQVVWRNAQQGYGYDWALQFARRLTEKVSAGEIPRTLIHDLARLYHERWVQEVRKPMWAPELFYILARRLRKEVYQELRDDFLASFVGQTLPIVTAYVSLITRKE